MPKKPIIFSATPALTSTQSRWMLSLHDHWPGGTHGTGGVCIVGLAPPPFLTEDLEQLTQRLTDTPDRDALPAAAVIAFAVDDPPWHIDRVVQALRLAQIPALILLPDALPWRAFQQGGVLFERLESEPAVLAAMLYALVERQQDFDLQEREAGLTRRCERNIREEMDRLHEELHLAASIQRQFNGPPPVNVPGLAFSTLSRPVSFVSGDVCCLRNAGEGRLAFLLADAAGHGVPAALLTMVLTHALATHEAVGSGESRLLEPAEVLSRLNRRLCEHCRGSSWFATAVYGIIDARSRQVNFASAGHPHPIILGPAGAREIQAEGPVLGIIPDGEFTQTSATLSSQEILVLYTDGLECIFPEEHASFARGAGIRPPTFFRDVHSDTEDESPQSVLARLERMIDEQVGSLHQADDVTAIAIAPAPLAAEIRLAA